MSATHRLFGAYDIRGIYGDALDEPFAYNLGAAFGHFLSATEKKRVLVGHDCRTHSPGLADALIDGLQSVGHDVALLGLASTPMVAWYGARFGFDGSIAVTASHLAKKYNGFKLYRGEAVPIGAGNGLTEIERLVRAPESNGRKARNGNGGRGVVTRVAGTTTYVEFLLSLLQPRRRLKVAVDAGHGSAAPEVELLASMTASVEFIPLLCVADGEFPARSPNPLDEGALALLSGTVVSQGCDFGVSFDGDADRAIFVDENGRMIPTDLMTGLIGGSFVEKSGGGAVVYDLRASRAVPEYIESRGGRAIRTGVGTMFIKSNMQENSAIFAGELSGHYYYGDMFDTDNALRTMIEVVNIVSQGDTTLSSLVEPLSVYSTSGEINLQVKSIEAVLRRLDEATSGGAKDRMDGLAVNFPQWWFAARGSQTEPVLRLTVGAVSREIMEDRTKHLVGLIENDQ